MFAAAFLATPLAFAQQDAVTVDWLDGEAPTTGTGVSWGVPWSEGKIRDARLLVIKDAAGSEVPAQTWPLAYWPDGSVKWSGHAINATPATVGPFTVAPGTPTEPGSRIFWDAAYHIGAGADDTYDYEIRTGIIRCRFLKRGSEVIESLYVGDRKVLDGATLVALREDRSQYAGTGILREERFLSRVNDVTVEQGGPVRSVVRIDGDHYLPETDRGWLPFVLRLYFHADSDVVRIVHSFVFDGEAEHDFIKGIGLSFSVPMQEELQNRHVRFVGQGTGVWTEPVRLLPGYRPALGSRMRELESEQMTGRPVPNLAEFDQRRQEAVTSVAVWNDFKLSQLGAGEYSLFKRTGSHSSWLHVTGGQRALGTAVLGDTSGGIMVGVREFWQKHPSSIEITGAAEDTARMTVWLWSPEATPMDLRHYDNQRHGLAVAYENVEHGYSTPHGIANTSEVSLRALAAIPENDVVVAFARTSVAPSHLVCTPEYYHSVPIFGIWSLPKRESPAQTFIEDRLDQLLAFYRDQVEERHWYGFWSYGDIMHNYDEVRHQWRYDIGGWAWLNTELMPDMFLWYSFLRTGRADVFRMAEAMTRHTSEVDVYHLGRFKGLGTRHGVVHWGDSSKEVRVGQSALKRFFYYLTADDRTGDLMREGLDALASHVAVDPLRKHLPEGRYASHVRSGPDFLGFASNWLAEWERTGRTTYRDKIITGMRSLARQPDGLLTALSFGYEPETGEFYLEDDALGLSHFVMIFGGAETAFELWDLVDVPEWREAWIELCEYFAERRGGMTGPRAAAFAAHAKKDEQLGRRAWDLLIGDTLRRPEIRDARPSLIDEVGVIRPVHDPVFPGAAVNWQLHSAGAMQWALNAIEVLELAGDYLDEWESERSGESTRR